LIKAKNSYLAQAVFNPYLQWLLKRNFSDFVLMGDFPALDKNKSYIITPNHFSWWDGFFVDYLLTRVTNHQIKIMMLENQLIKYWFFRFLGAFSVDQHSITGIIQSINYSRQLLIEKGNALVIYPQAEIQKFIPEKFDLKKGIKKISQDIPTEIIPLAFKIEYKEEPKPVIFCKVGNVINANALKNDFESYKSEFVKNFNFLLSFDLSKDNNNLKIKSLFDGKHK
jgi:hypothetical protein